MATSRDLEHEHDSNELPDNFQNGFVQAVLFSRGIAEPTGRDLADAIDTLQEYRLLSTKLVRVAPTYHRIARRRADN